MKSTLVSLAGILLLAFGTVNSSAQEDVTVVAPTSEAAEGLDLKAVSALFQDSKNLESFEKALNDPEVGVNNLDLDDNGVTARGEIYCITWLFHKDEERLDTWYGRYLDRYERRQGEWRIARRQFALDWIETAAPRDTPDEGVNDEDLLIRGKMSREDVSYSVLPSELARTLDW